MAQDKAYWWFVQCGNGIKSRAAISKVQANETGDEILTLVKNLHIAQNTITLRESITINAVLSHGKAHSDKCKSITQYKIRSPAPLLIFTMATKQHIQDFLSGFTAETTPGSAAKIPNFNDHLEPGAWVYITFLPGSDFNDTVAVAKRLREEGFEPIPHFAARSIPNHQTLQENLDKVTSEAGVSRVLCIAGAVDKPVGDFTDSTQLLETGLFDQFGIKHIAVAGHPEGSPDMSDESIMAALQWKNRFKEASDAEMHVVTQFVFEADPIIKWDQMLRAEGNKLPIHIGVPGLATLKTLLMHAKACGIGASMKVLTKQAKNISKLLVVNTPDKLVHDLAEYQATDPNCGITGVHMYPLGGLRRTAKWSYAVSRGEFTLNGKGGFTVDTDIS